MKRRNFILSGIFLVSGMLLKGTETFSHIATILTDGFPLLAEKSPIPKKRSGIVEIVREGRVTLMTNPHNRIMLNDIGSIIWKNIDGKTSCNHIAEGLATEFGIDMNTVSKEMETFVFDLKKEEFLKVNKMSPCYAFAKV